MLARLTYVFSLLLAGCVSFTTSGTKEAVLFSGADLAAEKGHAALAPYDGLPLRMQFICPDRLATLSTFYVFPVPPVVPVGFVNKDVSYLRVRMPADAESALAQSRIVMPQGAAFSLAQTGQSKRAYGPDGTLETTYKVDTACGSLDGGTLEVAGFSYGGKSYPVSRVPLQFDARITGSLGWWPPAMLRGKRTDNAGDEAEN